VRVCGGLLPPPTCAPVARHGHPLCHRPRAQNTKKITHNKTKWQEQEELHCNRAWAVRCVLPLPTPTPPQHMDHHCLDPLGSPPRWLCRGGSARPIFPGYHAQEAPPWLVCSCYTQALLEPSPAGRLLASMRRPARTTRQARSSGAPREPRAKRRVLHPYAGAQCGGWAQSWLAPVAGRQHGSPGPHPPSANTPTRAAPLCSSSVCVWGGGGMGAWGGGGVLRQNSPRAPPECSGMGPGWCLPALAYVAVAAWLRCMRVTGTSGAGVCCRPGGGAFPAQLGLKWWRVACGCIPHPWWWLAPTTSAPASASILP
jgi:hypothetical protein